MGTQVPLCSQSGCYHNGESCEAYLAERATGFVDYNGTLYQSLIDGNVWSPDVYPAGWEVYSVTPEPEPEEPTET